MMIKLLSILCLLSGFLFLPNAAFAQDNVQNSRLWNAKWISEKRDEGLTYGVYHFRKSIELAGKPESFVIHVSADNRYKLYVNGQVVSMGPARGDLHFWNYETVDIAPYLVSGQNVVSALVWNEAEYRPEAEISLRTAFIVQGDSAYEEILNTNGSWKCVKSQGHQPNPGFYFAASKGELVDMNQTIKGDWHAVHYDDNSWSSARELSD